MREPLKLWRNAQLATCDEADRRLANGALLTRGARIDWVGEEASLPRVATQEVHDLGGAWVTPGLIDCHTHLVFAATRAGEYAERLRGASYEDIARAGGGILSTVRAVRAASEDQLFSESAGDRFSDPPASTGHERCLTFEWHRLWLLEQFR